MCNMNILVLRFFGRFLFSFKAVNLVASPSRLFFMGFLSAVPCLNLRLKCDHFFRNLQSLQWGRVGEF